MKKWILLLIPVVLLITFYKVYADGYRVTALGAAKSNHFIADDVSLIDHYKLGSDDVYLFKSDKKEEYQTASATKSGFLYTSRVLVYWPYHEDEIETVGWLSSSSGTLLSVVSHDEDVAYIEAGNGTNRKRIETEKGKRITFTFTPKNRSNNLNPVAYNKEGEKLYYYGFPETNTPHQSTKDIKWHKVDSES
ncbi:MULTISPECIES: hypothetical protein [Pontibacillus]|uniref:DUF4652 domain-containing protein n=1 Tax=Pontibacillus chungwhensis TaxID=265426 RepID=A0ABY8V0A0_9BACI|nr:MULTISPECIES: hypothetical protein [Pontibacillus]MCD5324341.1 hypothetical protein [Pontibacillus sp. HN14]WIF99360.1 hypothetical protein QNI29_06800 [Pontibacillus chungwhensis]